MAIEIEIFCPTTGKSSKENGDWQVKSVAVQTVQMA